MHGPIGQNVSKFLPRSTWPLWNCTDREPTSLMHRVPEDVVERVLGADVLRARADDDAELDLVVDREPVLAKHSLLARDASDDVVVRRKHDLGFRPDDRARELDEAQDHLLVREDEPGLLVAVTRVVDARAEDLPGVRQRREDPVDRNGIPGAGGRGRLLEPALTVADERESVGIGGGEDLAVDLDAAASRVAGGVLHDSHRCAPFVVSCRGGTG